MVQRKHKIRAKTNPLMVGKQRKTKIHAALREQVWIKQYGETFSAKCAVPWCQNRITVFNFQCGHRLAESRGGATTLENLAPICGRCNQSMGTMHMDQWNQMGGGGQSPPPPITTPRWRLALLKMFRCFGS
jgi:hypothetical protein